MQHETIEVFMWGLAEVLSFTWIFFREIDVINMEGSRYFIVGYRPRKLLTPDDLKLPSFLETT